MMLKQLYFLILIQFPFVVLGQSVFPDKLPKVLPERFHIELDNDSISYFAKQKKKINTINDRSLLFINQFTKKDYFDSGVIAWNYDTIETYLNEIVTKLIPKEVIEEFNIHVYPSKEADFNAAALPDGTIFFNIHNFIYLNTESEIASILGHEIGHVLQEYHSGYEWLDYMNSSDDIFNSKRKRYVLKSQFVEINADYLSSTLIELSGYRTTSALYVFELFSKIENRYGNYVNFQSNKYLKTHPSSQERIDSAIIWGKFEQGSNFLVDSLLFHKIKQGSRINSLKYLMESHQYYGCFELALEGYLTDGNLDCAYYVAESLRRLFYKENLKPNQILFSGIYKNMFAYNCFDRVTKEIFISRHSDSILNEFKSKRIYTYQKIFEYFLNKVPEENNVEILLTKGLYEFKKSKKNINNLDRYVVNNGKYKLFVQELITPTTVAQPKSVYVFNNVSVWDCSGKKKVQHYFLEKELEHQFDSLSGVIFKEKCPVKDNNYIGVRNHLQVDLEESYFLNHLSNLVWYKKATKYNLTILSPELGQYLVENNYSSFQYIDYYYQACLYFLKNFMGAESMYISKIIEYKKNKKICIGYNILKKDKLTLKGHKDKLSYATAKSKH